MAKQIIEQKETNTTRVVIFPCSCHHEYQDKRYGKDKRVFNICQKDMKKNEGRCTVCGKKIVLK